MDNFPRAVERVLKSEGGYSNNPVDPGGETMWGITKRTALRYGYTGEMKFMPRETAVEIYRLEYWNQIRGDELPFSLAFQLFDFAINSGPPQAIRFLQRGLGLTEDGIFGPQTLTAALKSDPGLVAADALVARQDFQSRLPTWPAFGKGWANRNIQNARLLIQDLLA